VKVRVNRGQELVIAGYTPSAKNFDALVISYYEGPDLMYAARTRNGFTPASRAELFKKIKPLEVEECAHLPTCRKKRGAAGVLG
jgi:ATP-dependent DNA ligase